MTPWWGSTIEWEGDYYPYGNKNVLNNGTDNYFLFTGYEYDYELGDNYAENREQSPVIGRFFSPDPYDGSMDLSNPQSLNRYAYVDNDPANAVDPSGLFTSTGPQWWNFVFLGAPFSTWQNFYCGALGLSSNCLQGNSQASNGGGDTPQTSSPSSNNVSKLYTLKTPCSSNADQLMKAVENNFTNFANYSRWGGAENVTFSPPAQMQSGSTIPIEVGTFGISQTLQVTVNAVTPGHMTFTTTPGHLLFPAYITFAAGDAGKGSINFYISLGGRVTSPIEFNFGGGLRRCTVESFPEPSQRILQGGFPMIGSRGAGLLLLINIVLAGVFGAAVGGLASLALRHAWGRKRALTDALFSIGVAAAAAYLFGLLAPHSSEPHVLVILGIVIASVMVKYALEAVFRARSAS